MKANLFALFCITLFVLSVPQAFAEDVNSTITTPQTVEQSPTEDQVTEVPPTSVEGQPDVVPEPTKTVTKTQEPAPVENSADEEVEVVKSVAAADTETNKPKDGDDKVQTVEPVEETKSDPKTAPVIPEAGAEGDQDSTEQVAADDVVAPSGEENTTEENTAATATEENTTEENAAAPSAEPEKSTEANETNETTETPAVPTEAPGSTNATNATNTEPSAPVSSPEENQEAAPAAEENQETAPAAESEEQLEKKDGLSFFGLISKILVGLGLLSVVILVGCVYHYRYQMQKYKIAPFTPPSFLPECLFPRNTESSGRLISGYTELQVGNYQSAPRFAEI